VTTRRLNKLEDCRDHGAGSELFIVEGDSAASAVAALRNPQCQAVLPMQGKPLNPWQAGLDRVAANALYRRLSEVLNVPLAKAPATTALHQPVLFRFERILLLFDPDADGIHIGALMLMFFAKWMRPLLDQGSITMIRPPLYRLRWKEGDAKEAADHATFAHSYAQCQAMFESLRGRGVQHIDLQYFRGLANMDRALLREHCIDPVSRTTQPMGMADALAAVQVFSRAPKKPSGLGT
jgi:DNA gyrase subunit B